MSNELQDYYPQDPDEIARFIQSQHDFRDRISSRPGMEYLLSHYNTILSASSVHGVKIYNSKQEERAGKVWMLFGYIQGVQICKNETDWFLFYGLSKPNEEEVEEIKKYVLYDEKDWI